MGLKGIYVIKCNVGSIKGINGNNDERLKVVSLLPDSQDVCLCVGYLIYVVGIRLSVLNFRDTYSGDTCCFAGIRGTKLKLSDLGLSIHILS